MRSLIIFRLLSLPATLKIQYVACVYDCGIIQCLP